MKRYNITVNGRTYDVAVEEAGQASAPVSAAPVATLAPAPVAAPAPAPAASCSTSPALLHVTGGTKLKPNACTVIDVKVNVGDNWKTEQQLLFLKL